MSMNNGPRINPLTKFPLSISPPGSAALQTPSAPFQLSRVFPSIVGPVHMGFGHAQLTPVSWGRTPYLNKNRGSQSGIATPPIIRAR